MKKVTYPGGTYYTVSLDSMGRPDEMKRDGTEWEVDGLDWNPAPQVNRPTLIIVFPPEDRNEGSEWDPCAQPWGWTLFPYVCASVTRVNFVPRDQERHGVKETPVYCLPNVIRAMEQAWMRSGNGLTDKEAGFRLDGKTGEKGFDIVQAPYTNQSGKLSMEFIRGVSFALFHTHPNAPRSEPEPSGQDEEVADNSGMDIYTITNRGLWKYDPKTQRTVQLREGMKSRKPCED